MSSKTPTEPTTTTNDADTNKAAPKTKSSRKFQWLALVILLIFAGWSAFWYVSYSRTQDLIDHLMAEKIDGKPVLTCQDQTLGGYPFRLSLSCSSFAIDNPQSLWQVEGGPLRALWQVYDPKLAVIETESSLKLTHTPTGQIIDLSSELMRGSVRFDGNYQIAQASLEADMPTIGSNNPDLSDYLGDIAARKMIFHARPTPQTLLDLDLSLAATELSTGQFPQVSGQLSLTVRGGLSPTIQTANNPAEAWLMQFGKLDAINGNLELGAKTLKVNSDLAFDQAGLVTGLVKVRILNPPAGAATASKEQSAERDGLNGPLTALQLMGKPVKDGDLIGSEVEIKLNKGQVKAGFLTLGNIPALL